VGLVSVILRNVFLVTVFHVNELAVNEQSRIASRGSIQNPLGLRHGPRSRHDDMLSGVI